MSAGARPLEIPSCGSQQMVLNVVSAQTTELAAERTALEIQNRRLAATAQLLKNLAGRWKAGD